MKNRCYFKWLPAIVLMIASFPDIAYGQRDISEKASWSLKDRLYFGGGGNLNGGNGYFQVGLSPVVGYMLNPRLSVGVRALWQNTSLYVFKTSINQYGAGIFAQYNIFNFLFVYGEYGFINTPATLNSENRISISRLPLGLGYVQSLGKRGAINVTALYDVLFRSNYRNVYRSPWIFRIYFTY